MLPFLIFCLFAAIFDRVNAGFAALLMNLDPGFSAAICGPGAGVFFTGWIREASGSHAATLLVLGVLLISFGAVMFGFIRAANHHDAVAVLPVAWCRCEPDGRAMVQPPHLALCLQKIRCRKPVA